MTITHLKLTPAQLSAIQCAGILDGLDSLTVDEDILRLAISGDRLVVSVTTQETLARAINQISNDEDETSRRESGPMGYLAGRASRSLAALYLKVLKLDLQESK